jgi:hypothetical protein
VNTGTSIEAVPGPSHLLSEAVPGHLLSEAGKEAASLILPTQHVLQIGAFPGQIVLRYGQATVGATREEGCKEHY